MDFIPSLQNQSQAFSQLAETKMDRLEKKALSGEYKEEKELKALAQQFESIFMNQLMKSMRETLPKEGLLSSFSVDMYESMFDQEVAGEMSKGRGMGLADVLYKQLSRMNGKPPGGDEVSATEGSSSLKYDAPGKKENP
jgi:flagellar protein FlgJ